MGLQAGTRLGPYEVLSSIGAGGMGEVYRARDTRLNRAVAIKIVSPALAGDADFRDRFMREARAISSFNHAHICALYDVGQDGDSNYLVFELLEGETLAARLARGPLSIAQALRFAIQIASALEAAHRQGIVHRDLKPGNVMLTTGGVKLLDFGLAKQVPGLVGHAVGETATHAATAPSTLLGTLHYMAPEQLQGLPADARTDVFAFGALLYEMVSGRKAFDGSTQAGTLAKILENEPAPLTEIVPAVPAALDQLVRACVVKDRAERMQDIHDVCVALQWIEQQSPAPVTPLRRSRRREWLAWTLAATAAAIAAFTILKPVARNASRPTPTRTDILLPPRLWLHEYSDFPAVSPDGRTIAFAGLVDGVRRLYLRPVNAAAAQPLPNTEDAFAPFWSPDGRSVGFFAGNTIRKIDADGGGMVTFGSYESKGITAIRRGTIDPAGAVLFADGGMIWRAGEPLAVPVKETSGRATQPRFLPDGKRFIYFVAGTKPAIFVGSLATGQTEPVGEIPGPADYAAGHLLYVQRRTLMARPVDPVSLRSLGADFPVTDGVVAAHFSASRNGTIVIRPVESELATLVWFDRAGVRLGTLGEAAEYRHIALSPSGRRVAVAQGDPVELDLWTADTASGRFARVTSTKGWESDPAWSPDERYLGYSYSPGLTDFAPSEQRPGVRLLDVTTGEDRELANDTCRYVDDWMKDGRLLCRKGITIAAVSASGTGVATTLSTNFPGDQLHVSSDGQVAAYNDRISGNWEVYVAPFPRMAPAKRVSVGGGVQPLWRSDGRELFFLTLNGTLMSATIRTAPELQADTPKPLFKTNLVPAEGWSQYAVTPDGQRFLVKDPGRQFFTVLQNWLPERSDR
jgi:serine/threonine protein kinase